MYILFLLFTYIHIRVILKRARRNIWEDFEERKGRGTDEIMLSHNIKEIILRVETRANGAPAFICLCFLTEDAV